MILSIQKKKRGEKKNEKEWGKPMGLMEQNQRKEYPYYGKYRRGRKEKLFNAIIIENFQNQGREMDIQIYEAIGYKTG